MISTQAFALRFLERAQTHGPFCLGMDPGSEILQAWDLPDSVYGLRQFCQRILDALARAPVAMIKIQAAYFERFGPEGWYIMQDTIKRGDIGSTNQAYAEAYIGPKSPYQCDAITVTSYLGPQALMPFFTHAAQYQAGVFVVVRSSNPEGQALQEAHIIGTDQTVAAHVTEVIDAFNAEHLSGGFGPIGAVLGATQLEMPGLLPAHGLILAPGIGAQGATMEGLVQRYPEAVPRLIPTAARSVLKAGPTAKGLAQAIVVHQQEFAEALA
jgi:orotidine-5'-phosphate decarboxylase